YGLKANMAGRIIGRLAGCRNIVSGLRSMYPGNKKSRLHLLLDRLTLPLTNTQARIILTQSLVPCYPINKSLSIL
ncbi:hypothetical protein KJ557_04030, partial [Patescibacteria group bacterium]|nr:hypothetical protein [Patescibacteria group bacterium]